MLEFKLPLAVALLPLPLLVYWLTPTFRDRGDAVRAPFFQRLVDLTGQQPTQAAVVLTKTPLQRTIGVMSWILIVIGLAHPEWAGEPVVQEIAARDLLLVVDLSGSMEAE